MYRELESGLAESSAKQRRKWVMEIIDNDIQLLEFANLLSLNDKTALRFQWLISEVGLENKSKLHKDLPSLFKLSKKVKSDSFKWAFTNYWLIAGVPEGDEGEAVDLLFQCLLSDEPNPTIKTRAIKVLIKLSKTYPEIIEELKLSLSTRQDISISKLNRELRSVLQGEGE